MSLREFENDTKCQYCQNALVWQGSIMTGHLVCSNPFCMGCDNAQVAEDEPVNWGQPAPPTPNWGRMGGASVSAVMNRYYNDLANGHRLWCAVTYSVHCDCGFQNPCHHDNHIVESLEVANYGLVIP
jgi:hypothetical protein